MIKKIIKLREKFKEYNIDGYIIPKNDEFFSEYDQNDIVVYFQILIYIYYYSFKL